MRNGLYIQVLGRQSFEPIPEAEPSPPPPDSTPDQQPSQPSSSSVPPLHPADSSALSRAQNEVLLTVGELLRAGNPKPHESHAALIRENELGLLISTLDLTFNYFSTYPLIAVQNRVQCFAAYSTRRFSEVWRWELGGGIKRAIGRLYTGLASDLLFQAVAIVRDMLRERCMSWAAGRVRGTRRRGRTGWVVSAVGTAVDALAWGLVLYPIHKYSLLQSLLILPARPFLPPLSMFRPRITLRGFWSGPFLWTTIYAWWGLTCREFFYVNFRRMVPKPDSPSRASMEASRVFEGEAMDVPSILEVELETSPRSSHPRAVPGEQLEERLEPPTNIILSDVDSGQQYSVAVPPPVRPQVREERGRDQEVTPAASPRDLSRSSTDDENDEPETNGVSTRAATPPAPPPPRPVPEIPYSPPVPRRQRRSGGSSRRDGLYHKVTTLTMHPSEAAAYHLSDIFTRISCLAIETVALRALAQSALGEYAEGRVWGLREMGMGVAVGVAKGILLDIAFAAVSWEGTWAVCRMLV